MSYKDIEISRVKRRIARRTVDKTLSLDSLRLEKYTKDKEVNYKELCTWHQYWLSLADSRKRYLTNCDYNRGKQLEKRIFDKNGYIKTQRQVVIEQGKTPIVVNIVREMVRVVMGQYRQSPSKSSVYAVCENDQTASDMLSVALQGCLDLNEIAELDAQQLEIFLLSGMAISRTTEKFFDELLQRDVFTENVNNCMVFFNGDIKDVRGRDIHTIGEVIETTVDNVITTYAKNVEEALALRELLKPMATEYIGGEKSLNGDKYKSDDFFTASVPSNIRIFMGWTKKSEFRVIRYDPLTGDREVIVGDYVKIVKEIEAENKERYAYFIEQGLSDEQVIATLLESDVRNYSYWSYKVLTQEGYCLAEGESPFEHNEHPYTVLLRPLINGEVWGMVEDVKDIQDTVNQSFMMFKWIVEASAKGLLVIDRATIPEGMDLDDVAASWSEIGGVIALDLKPGKELPKEINTVSNTNVPQLLNFAMTMMDKVSGVHSALRGETANNGTPASLYWQQSQNSATSLLNFMRNFESYVKNRDTKILKTMLQVYETGRYIDVFGEAIIDEAKKWNKEMVKNVPFRLKVSSSIDNPVYRMAVEGMLKSLLDSQAIDAKLYLKKSTMPFAREVLSEIEKREEQQQQIVESP